jgi:hypothetical protein
MPPGASRIAIFKAYWSRRQAEEAFSGAAAAHPIGEKAQTSVAVTAAERVAMDGPWFILFDS